MLRLAAHTALWSILMPAIISGNRSRLRAPLVTRRRPAFLRRASRSPLGGRHNPKGPCLPKQQHRGLPSCQLAKEVPGFAKHRRRYIDRITVLSALYACQFHHQISTPLFFRSLLVFLIERSIDEGCGNMQETINCKLNYLDQCRVDLLSGRRLATDPAISLLWPT